MSIIMVKRILTACTAFAVAIGLSGLSVDLANATREEVTICHRTNAIKNPYVLLKVDANSVDGDTGNDNGQGDHYMEHTGPVFDNTMENGDDWGDIIPPTAGHQGLNYSGKGLEIYNNGCNVPGNTSGMLTVTSNCEEITISSSSIVPEDGTITFTLNGDPITAGTHPAPVGTHVVKLFVNEMEVASKEVTVEECVDGTPASTVSLVCPVNTYKLTVSNAGATDLKVEVNGVESTIANGAAAITADFNVGDTLTVKIDGEPVMVGDKLLNNFKLQTCQGMGSTVTTADTNPPANTTTNVSTGFGAGAATDVASLPVTSGSSAQIAGAIVTIGSVLAAAGTYVTRSRSGLAI